MIRRLSTLFFLSIVIRVGVCHRIIRRATDIELNDLEDCVCVEFYLCGPGNYIMTSGENIIDIRTGKNTGQKTKCSGEIEVCCRLRKETTASTTTTTVAAPVDSGRQCGNRNIGGLLNNVDNRILSAGGQAGFGEFPWMVAVFLPDRDLNLFVCGASIIQHNVVLTAAHCVYRMKETNIKIRAGDWDMESIAESLPHQERFVSRIIIHPDFNPGSLQNDIAILVLTSPLIFTSNVAPVCLPKRGILVNSTKCIATGWGKNKFGETGQFQNILKMIELSLIPHDECQGRLRTTRLRKHFKLHGSFICAGGEKNIDTCQGDGGGPLMCSVYGSNPAEYVQMGITSWGIGCGGSVPSVYTNVYVELPWLTAQLANIT